MKNAASWLARHVFRGFFSIECNGRQKNLEFYFGNPALFLNAKMGVNG